ncbi:DUF4102 domain-containing protein [Azoarcus communis]|uniref:tyrosine-type recombinase/integrase n=1 Tax=Parazoarcus communis TaxID=41977 RepID=UPI001459A0E7|nr:integrase arm-type DNA-binding domain-containing protein [Parazoarcus communis]NMG46590.1 DUF4102 domain-containing protein [Parazoarcus communis]
MPKLIDVLTDLQIKNWHRSKTPVAKSDGGGLTFTVSTAGTASWVLRYRLGGGRRKEVTLGNYPDLSLEQARVKARAYRVAIDELRDPAEEKQISKRSKLKEWRISDLVADFRSKRLIEPTYAANTIKYRNYDIDNVVLPKLGRRPVTEVTSVEIVSVLDSSKLTWTMAKRTLATISKLFDHACGLRVIAANPCTGIKISAIHGDRPPIRKRVMLTEDELRLLLPDASAHIGMENAIALKILLATCVRGAELVKARKEHVFLDRGSWWVPDGSVKTRSGFLVPLAPIVVEWFRELFALSGGSDYVLPARTERRRRRFGGDIHAGETTLWAAINRAFHRHAIDIQKFTPHDTRSTAKGHMRNMGISREMSEIALNHTLKGMEAIYDVREEIPERRIAMQKWADFIADCELGPKTAHPSNVIQLRSAR